jgi:hypothetical protein
MSFDETSMNYRDLVIGVDIKIPLPDGKKK